MLAEILHRSENKQNLGNFQILPSRPCRYGVNELKCRKPGCPASGQTGDRLKKTNDAENGSVKRFRTKLTRIGIFMVRDRAEIIDAGMPMPALVRSPDMYGN